MRVNARLTPIFNIRFRPDRGKYLNKTVKAFINEYNKFEKEMTYEPGFSSIGGLPHKRSDINNTFFLPMDITYLNEIFLAIKLKPAHKLIDLGSGDGRVVFLASLFGAHAVGIEGDKKLSDASLRMKVRLLTKPEFKLIKNTKIIHGDLFKYDLSSFDVAFMFYPEPKDPAAFINALDLKLGKELKPGSILVLHYFGSPHALVGKKKANR